MIVGNSTPKRRTRYARIMQRLSATPMKGGTGGNGAPDRLSAGRAALVN
jgi:hypothetical protein